MLLESDILRLFFTGPYLVSSPLCSVSGVDCPSVLPRQLLLFASLLSSLDCPPWSPAATPLSLLSSHQLPLLVSCHQLPLLVSCHQLPLLVSCHQLPLLPCHQLSSLLSNYQLPLLLSNYQLCLLGRVVNSHSPPRTTSGYGEISCPRILCLVSRQNRQLNRLLWQPTPIVLQFTKLFT